MREIVVRVVDVYVYRLVNHVPAFLLCRRAPDVLYAGQWRMIGGKIREGETAWQAALRELEEETRRKAEAFWVVPSVNCFYEWQHDRTNLIPVFAAELLQDPILNHEHDTFAWMHIEEALAHLQWEEQKRLLNMVNQIVSENRILANWHIST